MRGRSLSMVVVVALLAIADAEDPSPPVAAPPAAAARKLANAVARVAVSPDGKTVAAIDSAQNGCLFTAGDERVLELIPRCIDPLLFTRDGKFLLFMQEFDKSLGFCDVTKPPTPRAGKPGVWMAQDDRLSEEKHFGLAERMSADAELKDVVADGGSNARIVRRGRIDVWNVATGALVQSEANPRQVVQGVAVAEGSPSAVSFLLEGVEVTDPAKNAKPWSLKPSELFLPGMKKTGSPNDYGTRFGNLCGFTTDGRHLVVLVEGGRSGILTEKPLPNRVAGYDAATGKLLWQKTVDATVARRDVVVGLGVAAIVEKGQLTWWNTANGQVRETAPSGRTYTCVAVAGDGLTFWAGTSKGHVLQIKTIDASKPK